METSVLRVEYTLVHLKYLLCHACHPWHCKNYIIHSFDYEIPKAMRKSPGVLLHMLRDYTAIKEGLEPNENCLRDGYTVAVIYQKIFQDGTCMTVIYH